MTNSGTITFLASINFVFLGEKMKTILFWVAAILIALSMPARAVTMQYDITGTITAQGSFQNGLRDTSASYLPLVGQTVSATIIADDKAGPDGSFNLISGTMTVGTETNRLSPGHKKSDVLVSSLLYVQNPGFTVTSVQDLNTVFKLKTLAPFTGLDIDVFEISMVVPRPGPTGLNIPISQISEYLATATGLPEDTMIPSDFNNLIRD